MPAATERLQTDCRQCAPRLDLSRWDLADHGTAVPRFELIYIVRVGAHPIAFRQPLSFDHQSIAEETSDLFISSGTGAVVRGAGCGLIEFRHVPLFAESAVR
jgi:hypothetical protein